MHRLQPKDLQGRSLCWHSQRMASQQHSAPRVMAARATRRRTHADDRAPTQVGKAQQGARQALFDRTLRLRGHRDEVDSASRDVRARAQAAPEPSTWGERPKLSTPKECVRFLATLVQEQPFLRQPRFWQPGFRGARFFGDLDFSASILGTRSSGTRFFEALQNRGLTSGLETGILTMMEEDHMENEAMTCSAIPCGVPTAGSTS